VVAEGVESDDVWRRLGQLGCDVAQGFAIARPMALADLTRWVEASNNAVRPAEEARPVARVMVEGGRGRREVLAS
jgi:predicted signal transduction protein with EAL and GGDEF domain